MTLTKKPKPRVRSTQPTLPKLSAALRARYDATLDPDYWGRMTWYTDRNGEQVKRPLVVTTKNTLNFWKKKCGMNKRAKLELMADLWREYQLRLIEHDRIIQYREPLRMKRIREHNADVETVYYVTRWDSPVEQVLFDYDNHDHIPDYDTLPAALHINGHFADQQFIQPSTSGTGTHGYLWIEVQDENGFRIDLDERKRWYRRCVRACREELRVSGFRCWRDLDSLKGVAAKVSWQKSDHPADRKNPFYLQYERGGRLAKLPRLSTAEDERRYLDRQIVTWKHFCEVVEALEKKHAIVAKHRQGAGRDRSIVSIGTGTDSERKNATTIDQMLMATDKQRVALASVFRFQQLHGRHPDEADLPTLNGIYNRTPTHTGNGLTEERIDRFRRAITYSAKRPILCASITATAPLVAERLRGMGDVDQRLSEINEKLVRAKQRAITVDDVAMVFCYLRNNILSNDGYVPRDSLLALSARERKRKKLSANAIGMIMSLLADLKLVAIVAEARKFRPGERGTCARYQLLRDIGVETESAGAGGAAVSTGHHVEQPVVAMGKVAA